jgi:hypothetical protein
MNEIVQLDFTFYLVRNKEGKFFRSKGWGGYGDTWVEDPKRARVYQKISQARSRVSFFANNYPEYGVPDLVAISASQGIVLDESKRVEKAKKSAVLKASKQAKCRAEQEKKYSEADLARARARLAALGG